MTILLGTIDAGGDGKTILFQLISEYENTVFSQADFEILPPTIPTEINPVRNTIIKLIPKALSGFYGVKTVYYNRIHASEFTPLLFPKGTAVNVSDLLPAICERFGILMTDADIVDAVLPVADEDGMVEFNLVISPTSFLYYGSARITLGEQPPNIKVSGLILGVMDPVGGYAGAVTSLYGQHPVNYGYRIDNSKTLLISIPSIEHDYPLSEGVVDVYDYTEEHLITGTLLVRDPNSFMVTWAVGKKFKAMDKFGDVFESSDGGITWVKVGGMRPETISLEDWYGLGNISHSVSSYRLLSDTVSNHFSLGFGMMIAVVSRVEKIYTGVSAEDIDITQSNTFYISNNYGIDWTQINTAGGQRSLLNAYSETITTLIENGNYNLFALSSDAKLLHGGVASNSVWTQSDLTVKINDYLAQDPPVEVDQSVLLHSFFINDDNLTADLITPVATKARMILLFKHPSTEEPRLAELVFDSSDLGAQTFTTVNSASLDEGLVKSDLGHRFLMKEAFGFTTYDKIENKTFDQCALHVFCIPYFKTAVEDKLNQLESAFASPTQDRVPAVRIYFKHASSLQYLFDDIEIPFEGFKHIQTSFNNETRHLISIDNYGLCRFHFTWNENEGRYHVSLVKELDYAEPLLKNGVNAFACKNDMFNDNPWFNFGPTFVSPSDFVEAV